MTYPTVRPTTPTSSFAAVKAAGEAKIDRDHDDRRQDRARATPSRRTARRGHRRCFRVSSATTPMPRSSSRLRSARITKAVVRKRIVEDGIRIDGRGPTDLRPLSAEVGVIPTAHGSGLFQRGETQVLNITTLGMKRMDQMIDGIDADRLASATCTTTTSRRSPPVRPASCVARSVVRSATVRSPSVRSFPVIPSLRGVALHAAPRLRGPDLQRFDLDGVGLRFDPVADGRRCADQGARRRYRHGPRLRRGQVHHPHRHPRCRRRLRRHGLQGRRYHRLRHGPPARHEDRRHPGRRPRRAL